MHGPYNIKFEIVFTLNPNIYAYGAMPPIKLVVQYHSDLCSVGVGFESLPGHLLSWIFRCLT
jgi:hypothetical protein